VHAEEAQRGCCRLEPLHLALSPSHDLVGVLGSIIFAEPLVVTTGQMNVIDSFELERQRPDAATVGALQRAFEDVGLVFLPDDDVRVRAATSPDK
jgi:hypothetical protein